jgi:hypothetical protein
MKSPHKGNLSYELLPPQNSSLEKEAKQQTQKPQKPTTHQSKYLYTNKIYTYIK